MNANTETEDRLTAEWEPEVKLKRRGVNGRHMQRKLVTTGIYRIEIGDKLDEAKRANRSGMEVRFTWHGEDAIRSIPVANKDLCSIDLSCQSMGGFRSALRDLKIKFFKRFGKRVKKSEVMKEDEEHSERYDEFHEAIQSITPDMMATCPNCGTQFRIGKQLK